MIFKQMRVDNFLSLGHVDLEFKLNGIVSILGKNEDTDAVDNNGSGKTAIADAVMWILYGKIIRGKKGKHVQNRNGDGKVKGWLLFEYDGVDYEITRTDVSTDLVFGGKSYSRLKDDTEEKILSMLPSIELFGTMVYMSDKSPYRFASYNNRDRTEMIESLIDFTLYEYAREKVRSHVRDLEDSKQEKELALMELHGKIEAIECILDDLHKDLEDSKGDKDEDRAQAIRDQMDDLRDYSKLDMIQQLETEKKTLKKKLQKDHDRLTVVTTKLREVQSNINRSQGAIEEIESLEDKCPTCGQQITRDIRDGLLQEHKEAVQTNKRNEAEHRDSVDLKKFDIDAVEKKVNRIDGDLEDCRHYQSLVKQLETIEESEELNVQFILSSIKQQTGELEKVNDGIVNINSSIEKLKNDLQYQMFWDKGFSPEGIRSNKLDNVVGWINDRIGDYAKQLFGDGITVGISTQSKLQSGETRSRIRLVCDYGGGDYDSLSDSERRRVDFAIHLALRDLSEDFSGEHYNVLFLDEIFNGLDSTAVKHALDLLQGFSENIAIYIISHKDEIKHLWDKYCDSSITVTKKKGVSSLN